MESGFQDISSIKSANGKSYIQQKINGLPQLLIVLIQGKYGLLYDEQNKLFFILKDNLLKIISRDHIKRALPLIFGDELMDQFFKKTKLKPTYSFKYLERLTVFVNESNGSIPVVNRQNLNEFKKTVYIGPYFAVGKYAAIFDLPYIKKGMSNYYYSKTKSYFGNSTPVGLQMNIVFSPKISFSIAGYFNQTSFNGIVTDSIGFYKIIGKSSLLIPEKFDPKLKWNGYSFKTVNLDLDVNYVLTKNKFGLKPYVFAGPSVVIMTQNEVLISAKFINDKTTESYINRWFRSKRSEFMIAYNAGAGLNYQTKKRILLSLSGKIQIGNFPKISEFRILSTEENTTPVESSVFGEYTTSFTHRFDQHSKLFSINAAVLFKL